MDIKEFLNLKAEEYNNSSFIKDDPIQIPHLFNKKEDIEISGFLTSTISWGNRKSIITSSIKMMKLMDNDPHNFIINHSEKDLKKLLKFVHRTFNGYDFIQFIISLRHIYMNYGGLEKVFAENIKNQSMHNSIHEFKKIFFEIPHTDRTKKHVSDPLKGSASKRINMFLRWMVRKDERGVDFGLWNGIKQKDLLLPLDVHTGNVARKLGILKRKQNDVKAVIEVTNQLSAFCPSDPIKYDYALFGLGSIEKF